MSFLRFRTVTASFALFGMAACGARSQLYTSPPEETGGGGSGGGGTGGTTTSSTTSSSSSTTTSSTTTSSSTTTTTSEGGGGTGGGPLCSKLEYAAPFASFAGGMMANQRAPRAAYSADDGSRVTIASSWTFGGGNNAPQELRRTNLTPWPDFPVGVSLGNTNIMDLDAGVSFSIAQNTNDRFAMAFADFQQPPMGGLRFSSDFDPNDPNPPDTFIIENQAQRSTFLTRNGSRFLFGSSRRQGDTHEIRVGTILNDALENTFIVGCMPERSFAEGIAVENGFLFAYTSKTSIDNPGCEFMSDPGPNDIYSLHVGTFVGADLVALTSFGEAQNTFVRMAPRSDGAWLAWTSSVGGDANLRIEIAHLSPKGDVLANIQLEDVDAAPFAIASFNNYLMMVYLSSDTPNGQERPRAQVFSPDLEPLGNIFIEGPGNPQAQFTLVSNPNAPQVMFAWSESSGDNQPNQVQITRIDCLDQ